MNRAQTLHRFDQSYIIYGVKYRNICLCAPLSFIRQRGESFVSRTVILIVGKIEIRLILVITGSKIGASLTWLMSAAQT